MDDMMLNLRRIGWLSMPLRAAFAIVFLIFSSVQPAMFAGSPTDSMAMAMAAAAPAAQAADSHDHSGGHVHGMAQDDDSSAPQKHNSTSKSCEVHCAPIHAMPVAYCDIAPNYASCFEPIRSDALKPGEYAEFIRPPRHLI